ncbi:MAG: hypothetical protein HQK70_10375 [Desulfamplus sp.]|nr:hypothetical protein [Desulfamplus sp.]
MADRSSVFSYLVDTYYEGNTSKVAEATGYTKKQIDEWRSGKRQPQKDTLEYFIHCIFTPEFKVIVEYGEFRQGQGEHVLTQLKVLLKGHEERSGIYAFYDSMGNLLYIGKATKLLQEAYAAINREVHVRFPAGVKTKPEKRHEIIRYVSAYDVGTSNWIDYPKHVESLILRISKPVLNKNIGSLEKAYIAPQES